MNFVLGLPAEGLARSRRCEPEQDAAVELQRAGAEVVDRREDLRPEAMVLFADRREMADWAGLAIGLETGLNRPAGLYPRLPGIDKTWSPRRAGPNSFSKKMLTVFEVPQNSFRRIGPNLVSSGVPWSIPCPYSMKNPGSSQY